MKANSPILVSPPVVDRVSELSNEEREHLAYLERTARYFLTLEGGKTKFGILDIKHWWKEEKFDEYGSEIGGCPIGQMIHLFPKCGLTLEYDGHRWLPLTGERTKTYIVMYKDYAAGFALIHYFPMFSSDDLRHLFGVSGYSFFPSPTLAKVGQRILDRLEREGLIQNVQWEGFDESNERVSQEAT